MTIEIIKSRKCKLSLLLGIFIFISCHSRIKPETDNSDLYWLYSPIIQEVDKETEKTEFKFTKRPLNKQEARALIMVASKRGYVFKVTIDSQILISKESAPDITALSFLE